MAGGGLVGAAAVLRIGREEAPPDHSTISRTRRIRGERGKQFLRRRGELLERTLAPVYDTGGMRRTHLRGHRNSLQRRLLPGAAFHLSLVLRREVGVGTPCGLPDLVNRLFFCCGAVGVALESLRESSGRLPAILGGRFPILPPGGPSQTAA